MKFKSYLRAGYPILWLETFEEDRAIKRLSAESEGYKCFQWDIVKGLEECDGNGRQAIDDPVGALNAVLSLPTECVIYIKDAHRFMEDLSVCRTLRALLPALKSSDRHIVLLAPTLNIPIELQKDITVIDFALPTVEELAELAATVAAPYRDQIGDVQVSAEVISAARGLTMAEAENAFARSLIETKGYSREILEAEKLQQVRKSGLAEIYPPVPVEQIGGLPVLKKYVRSRQGGFADAALPNPKGILLGGCPGSGKSLFAKAVAGIFGFPLMRVDIGALKGGIVGESEKNMRALFALIKAVFPVVVWFDEFEKSISGAASSGKSDGGTTANMVGMLLNFMEECSGLAYFVATCNDMKVLLETSQGAFLRRFDDVFFVDLPGKGERAEILQIMCKRYGVSERPEFASIDAETFAGWTGAEIEKFVKNALYDGIPEAMANIKPISVQNRKELDEARAWAKYNAIMANETDGQQQTGARALKLN